MPKNIDTKKLLESKVFCMMPLVHTHAFADGRVYPCCFASMNKPYGSLRENTIEEIWNNEHYKKLRRNMLNNRTSVECAKCYEQEKFGGFSLRQSINQSHGKYVDEVEKTHEDGYHPDFKIRYWDVRFSNLCNFSCRTCGPMFSSNWYKEHKKMYGRPPELDGKVMNVIEYAGKDKYDIWNQMQDHIPYLDQVYFAGGEPLLMEEHYWLLEKLLELGKTDINIQYNTNFSELYFKKKNVVELWKHFSNVNIGASLDASGHRAELMRKGTNWKQIEANRETLLKDVPHIDFYISATLSNMNVLHILDFHKDWTEKGYIKAQDFNVNLLYSPNWYRIDVLPEQFKKDTVLPAYYNHLDWLKDKDKLTRATIGYQTAINMMEQNDKSDLLVEFNRQIKTHDLARDESFWDVFPELGDLKID